MKATIMVERGSCEALGLMSKSGVEIGGVKVKGKRLEVLG